MQGDGGMFVRRDLAHVPAWLRLPAWWLARREARAFAGHRRHAEPRRNCCAGPSRAAIAVISPARRCINGRRAATLRTSARARRLLQQLHRRGVAHNDLAKEANWLVLADGTPALIDFQLAVLGRPRNALDAPAGARGPAPSAQAQAHVLPAVADSRRTAPAACARSWLRDAWFATGKPVYRFVTRRLLHWEDNEGQGPKP
jgi:hypothetical protein